MIHGYPNLQNGHMNAKWWLLDRQEKAAKAAALAQEPEWKGFNYQHMEMTDPYKSNGNMNP
jgi:hypothetical protein